jgi:cyclase
MLTRRVVACLDVRDGRAVKGVQFDGLRDVGDPAELAERYESDGADEIVWLDVSATPDARATLLESAKAAARRLSIPLTIGGGIRTADDAARALRSGADKVSVNSAAVERPALIGEVSRRFGAQAVVASVDARRSGAGWLAFTHGGRRATSLDAVEWACRCAELGAGEILLTSIDRDGRRCGYDLELVRAVSQRVRVPVVASGGAGTPFDVGEVLATADAALVAGILHDGVATIASIKRHMITRGIPTRPIDA